MNWADESEFLKYIQGAIQQNKLSLPTLPDVALRVREKVASATANTADIARQIATDAAMSARLLQVANSPMFRAKEKIETLQVAINRLGLNTVRTLVTSLAMQQMFAPKSSVLAQFCQDIWQHSVKVSALSRVLASRYSRLDPDQAMLSGLIHQIGKLPILTIAEKTPELWQDRAVFETLLEHLHPQLGKLILEAWNFPASLVQVASEYHSFARTGEAQADYVDVVQIAYLGIVGGNSQGDLPVPLDQVAAFSKLGLEPGLEILTIDGVADEMQAVQTQLS